ncbi:MAG: hypothetical protein U1E06_17650 [Tabrizicola sp.]|nr:hypothetical protein [Tabrizicola sp.]
MHHEINRASAGCHRTFRNLPDRRQQKAPKSNRQRRRRGKGCNFVQRHKSPDEFLRLEIKQEKNGKNGKNQSHKKLVRVSHIRAVKKIQKDDRNNKGRDCINCQDGRQKSAGPLQTHCLEFTA